MGEINLEEKFSKFEKKITEKALTQKSNYYGNDVYKRLEKRIDRLTDSNNMEYGQDNNKSKIGFPIQKARSMMRKFIFDGNYPGENLATVKKTSSTDRDNAKTIEEAMNDNLRRTRFLQKDFDIIKQNCAEWGTGVAYSVPDFLMSSYMVTVNEGDGFTRKEVKGEEDTVIKNLAIDPRNKFQDPGCPNFEDSLYHGHVERIYMSEFISQVESDKSLYVKKNVNKIREKILKVQESVKDTDYKTDATEDGGEWQIDKTIMYSTLNIEGNEDNQSPYYLEIVDGKIIRIQKDIWDRNMMPYTVFRYIRRTDVWWGGTDGELILPHENIYNALMGLKLDVAMRALDQYIFYGKGTLDSADWNNRRVNGGLIGVDVKEGTHINNMLAFNQFEDRSVQGTQDAFREINSSVQSTASNPNVNTRQSKSNPMENVTAAAVHSLEDQGDIKEGSYLNQFNYGLIYMFRLNINMMRQVFPDEFAISAADGNELLVGKDEIFGALEFIVRTAYTSSKTAEAKRLNNVITMLMNLRGTQDPAFQRINMEAIVENLMGKLDIGDNDVVYPEAQPQQQQQQQLPAPQPQPQGVPIAT